MHFSFFYGPDFLPFAVQEDGRIDQISVLPFHGIISRGLLNKFIKNDLSVQSWHEYIRGMHDKDFFLKQPDLEIIQQYTAQCSMLTYSQSAICAKSYIAFYCKSSGLINPSVRLVNIKEGHTSSVWKVAISAEDKSETFVLNVARDQEAGAELRESSEKLKTIGDAFPKINMAKVNDIFILKDDSMPSEVVITRNEWIENAYEIHSRKNKKSGDEELILVDRFFTDASLPAHITSVLGKVFSPAETQKIQFEIKQFITFATTCLPARPHININDGDVVWDGKKAIIVALS
jgi:hypothetical protein